MAVMDCLIEELYNLLHGSKGVVWLWPGRLAKRCRMSTTRVSGFLSALALTGLIASLGYWARRKKTMYLIEPNSELARVARGSSLGTFARWLLAILNHSHEPPVIPGARNSITSSGLLAITALPILIYSMAQGG